MSGEAIPHEIERETMLEPRLQPGEHQREAFRRRHGLAVISGPSLRKPVLVMLTNVVPSGRAVNCHSTVVGWPYADHSISIRALAGRRISTAAAAAGTSA